MILYKIYLKYIRNAMHAIYKYTVIYQVIWICIEFGMYLNLEIKLSFMPRDYTTVK